jgi:hypothetical protein
VDSQKLQLATIPPANTDQANPTETSTAEAKIITASIIQLITCIFCRSNKFPVTPASNPEKRVINRELVVQEILFLPEKAR